jgi:hypothetical protein
MRALRRLFALTAALFVLGGGSREAHAAPSAGDDHRRAISVAIVGGGEEARLLEETIREIFARRGMTVVSASADAPPGTILARVNVDLGDGTGPSRFVVADGRSGEPVVERTVPREAGDESIVREEIALAVRSAVESELLHDDQPPPPEAPAPAPIAQPPPDRDAGEKQARQPTAYELDVATFAGAGWVAESTGPVPRIGVGVSVASRRGARPSIALAFQYALPFETSTALLSSHTSLVGLRVLPGLTAIKTSGFMLDVGLGGGLDVLAVEPRSAVLPPSTLGASTTRGDAVLSAAVSARVALVPSVTIALSATTDVDFATRSYVVDNGGMRSDVLDLWHLRPAILIGLGITALGDGPFDPEAR